MIIKDINFFDRYKEVQRREKTISKETAVRILVITVIIMGTVITTFFLQLKKTEIQGEIDSINTFITSPQTQARVAEIEKKQQVLTNVTSYHDAIALANSKLATIIRPDKDMVQSITSLLPTGTVITDFTYSSGSITLQCKSDSEDKIAQYVHKLKALEKVHTIGYTGFQKGEVEYESSITISLLPGGVKDAINQ